MNDIGAELLEKVKRDFTEFSKRNKYIQDCIKKLESGRATLSEVDSITRATGYALKVALEKNIAENVAAFADEQLITEILGDIFGDNYELINSVAENVQKQLDKAAGIGIKPQRADFPSERIENLAKITAQKDLADKAALSEFTASVENINGSIFTDYIRANAEFRDKAGLQVYVIRTDHGGCCEWCAKLAGKYVYPDVPKDVWRRHKRCSCEITYVNERAGTYDKISYFDRQDGDKIETRKWVTKLTPEQAFQREKEVLSRLDKRRESGIIKENIVVGRSVGAASKNYPVKLPSGNHAKIVEGTEITGIKTFAGKGTNTPIRVAKQLEDKYKIKAEKWEKVRGTAYIRENGTNRKVELHWYEADGERVEMKVKRYFDED